MNETELLKQRAAQRAVSYVRSNSAIGLGTGSTMRYALEELGKLLAEGSLHNVVGVPTSERTAELARQLNIPIFSLAEYPELDLAIDGADEIDPHLDLIKGLGGALLREKIIAAAARELIIIADASKPVPQLGSRAPLPVEVIPLALPVVLRRLHTLGGEGVLRVTADGQPFRTDEGNYIIDYACGPIANPAALDVTLLCIPGVVDHGLFLGMAQRAIVADNQTIRVMQRGE